MHFNWFSHHKTPVYLNILKSIPNYTFLREVLSFCYLQDGNNFLPVNTPSHPPNTHTRTHTSFPKELKGLPKAPVVPGGLLTWLTSRQKHGGYSHISNPWDLAASLWKWGAWTFALGEDGAYRKNGLCVQSRASHTHWENREWLPTS